MTFLTLRTSVKLAQFFFSSLCTHSNCLKGCMEFFPCFVLLTFLISFEIHELPVLTLQHTVVLLHKFLHLSGETHETSEWNILYFLFLFVLYIFFPV